MPILADAPGRTEDRDVLTRSTLWSVLTEVSWHSGNKTLPFECFRSRSGSYTACCANKMRLLPVYSTGIYPQLCIWSSLCLPVRHRVFETLEGSTVITDHAPDTYLSTKAANSEIIREQTFANMIWNVKQSLSSKWRYSWYLGHGNAHITAIHIHFWRIFLASCMSTCHTSMQSLNSIRQSFNIDNLSTISSNTSSGLCRLS